MKQRAPTRLTVTDFLPQPFFGWKERERKPFRDPIRVPGESEVGGRTNPFFVNFYRSLASEIGGF